MATSVQQIWDQATQLSSLNDESIVNPTQIIQYIAFYERELFFRAARLNPQYFEQVGQSQTLAAISGTAGWDLTILPGFVAAVTRVEVGAFIGSPYGGAAVGDKIELVSSRWPELGIAPRAYLRGRKVFPVPISGGITSGNTELGTNASNMVTQLNVFFSPLPTPLTALTQTLTLPDEFTQILVYRLARVLAVRDRRTDEEMNWLTLDLEELHTQYDEAVLTFDYGMRRPLNMVPPIPSPVTLGGAGQQASRARGGQQ